MAGAKMRIRLLNANLPSNNVASRKWLVVVLSQPLQRGVIPFCFAPVGLNFRFGECARARNVTQFTVATARRVGSDVQVHQNTLDSEMTT